MLARLGLINTSLPPTKPYTGRNIMPLKSNECDTVNFQKKSKTSNLSFTSRPIFDIKIKEKDLNGKYNLTPAKFTELESSNDEDLLGVLNIQQDWKKTDYAKSFCKSFFNYKDKSQVKHYAIEVIDDSKPLNEKIVSIMKTDMKKGIFQLCLLQVSPILLNNENKPLKGLGEVSFYAAVKLAKDKKAKGIEIISTNDAFYNKLGKFKTIESFGNEGSVFFVDESQFDYLLNSIKEKYKL